MVCGWSCQEPGGHTGSGWGSGISRLKWVEVVRTDTKPVSPGSTVPLKPGQAAVMHLQFFLTHLPETWLGLLVCKTLRTFKKTVVPLGASHGPADNIETGQQRRLGKLKEGGPEFLVAHLRASVRRLVSDPAQASDPRGLGTNTHTQGSRSLHKNPHGFLRGFACL